MFQGGQQHDSQELLLLLVDCLVDSLSYATCAGEQSGAGGSSRSSAAPASPSPLLPSSPCADIFAGSTCGATANCIAAFVNKIAFCIKYDAA
jgi:hypothetical protein